jgi:hypothetical protein
MSYDDIQNLWKSPGNRPSAAALEQERLKLVRALRREHRGLHLRLGLAMAWLAATMVGTAWHILSGGPFSLAGEWAVLVLLALPWIAAVLFIRRQLQHRRAHAGFEQSVRRSVRAMLDATHAAQQRSRIMQWLLGLGAPVLAGCIWQLQAVGKARPHEAVSMATVMAVIIAASWSGIYWNSRRLGPKERQLAELAAELEG